jgi:transposase
MADVFCGVDWGGSHHWLCAVDERGERLLSRRFSHDCSGCEELASAMARLGRALPVAVERSEGILVEKLQQLGHIVYPVNPRVAARAREGHRIAASKDDAFDAYVLAELIRQQQHRLQPLRQPGSTLAELRVLVRDRQRILENQVRIEAQLRATLEAYHPGVLHLFSSLDRDVTLEFIRSYPTPEKSARVGTQRMSSFLVANSYRGRQPAETLVKRLRANLLAAAPGTAAGKRRTALALVEQLELLNRQLKSFESAIGELLKSHPDADLFLSFPGVGVVLAATMLAEMGEDRSRFPQPTVLLAEAGLAPVTRASGHTKRVRFRYAANASLRDAFCWWSFNTLRLSPWARSSYEAGRSKGQHHHRALRGLSARWARVLWRCWQDGVPYRPELHHATAA